MDEVGEGLEESKLSDSHLTSSNIQQIAQQSPSRIESQGQGNILINLDMKNARQATHNHAGIQP
jgi:hypothetical protein